jgi:hypothetical protein
MQPNQVPTPPGFVLLGMLLATLGGGCAIGVAASNVGHVERALFGLVSLLTLVLVEALWWVRPWLVRAVDAWAATCVGVLLLPALVGTVLGAGGFFPFVVAALAVGLFVGLPCAGVRWYVRNRAKRLGLAPWVFVPPAAPVAVPVPRP